MSARNKLRTCAYCGRLKKATADHVPPKSLLERPYPPNLLTVPACEPCNSGFKSDDEYTRTVLALDIRAGSHRAVISNLPSIVRSLERPDARGFAQYLASQSTLTKILAWNGAPITSLNMDRQRVDATGMHILRGLYYLQHRRPMPKDAAVRVGCVPEITPDSSHAMEIIEIFKMFPEHRRGKAGTAFTYATAFGHQRSVWLMVLYDYFLWMGTIDERPASERALDDPENP